MNKLRDSVSIVFASRATQVREARFLHIIYKREEFNKHSMKVLSNYFNGQWTLQLISG